MKKYHLLFICLLSICVTWAQDFRQMIEDGSYTVAEIQAAAEAHFAEVGTERGTGFKSYKRWEYRAIRNMDDTGMLKSQEFYIDELENYNATLNESFQLARTTVGTWEELGPTSWTLTGGYNPGVGRITSVAFENGNADHMIVGGVSGGVWKTTDGGNTWAVLTDNMPTLNVYSLAIDPTNPSIYFWGSTGGNIYKSTDGGATWNFLSDMGNGAVNRILIDPTDTSKMYCSSASYGIRKSTDSGATWTDIYPFMNSGYDIEFKPGDYNTIYASGEIFLVSTNGGASFLPVTGFGDGPKMIGVSENVSGTDANILYVLEADGGGFGNLYKSTNSGASFTTLDHTGKNYFGYNTNPTDPDTFGPGQAPRDMDIAVHPTNVDEVHIAGINTWRSTNGGLDFTITSQWNPQSSNFLDIGYCHADIDMLKFVNNKLYVCSDGGIFVADDPSTLNVNYYRDLTAGLGIHQFYKIGISQTDPVIINGGSQDNGTTIMKTDGTWEHWMGGDGMEAIVDKNNSNIIYGTVYFGSLYKDTNGGANYTALGSPDNKSGEWVTPYEQDPIAQDVLYGGFDQVYKSTDGGQSWLPISQLFSGNLDQMKVATSNPNYIYASNASNLYRTTDGGATNWQLLSGFNGYINSIAIHPSNPNKVAIATNSSQKVYVSDDAGATWTPYLYDLPNFTALALVWHDNGEDGLYLGMNYGVYYIDNETPTSWQPFSNNLPNAEVSELEINTANNKIYCATFGRGVWASDLYDASLSVEDFELNSISIYPNPATKDITLEWDRSTDVSIRIYDALGKLMYYSKNESLGTPKRIDISSYASGLYFVKVNNVNGVITKKLIIE
ncbi:T9SS type A sorting domain-containing protein [uncultured Psychroserpens sp.]|uniref:T9SS type A sorting domain-containing protein n=1 Tax=uncultured Psychroserpens sp. TaxID=255436 RepID=UPI0026278691|nr:T9SS type A sorting domain-containing protein [uncultured Psychroserpens sp.]